MTIKRIENVLEGTGGEYSDEPLVMGFDYSHGRDETVFAVKQENGCWDIIGPGDPGFDELMKDAS